MKRVFLLLIVTMGLALSSCNNLNQPSTNENTTNDVVEPDYPPELVEMANQYHFNIDTSKTYDIDIKVFQSLGDYECLAKECSDKRYKWYYGQVMYYWSSDMVYDDKIIKEKAYLLGTYHYFTKDNTKKVVPFYCSTEAYEKNIDIINLIMEIQDYK